jgi:hypothetical protein
LTDRGVSTLDYQNARLEKRPSAVIRIGIGAGVAADVALVVAIFIWNGSQVWGPYLNPPVTIYWARPLFIASMAFGSVALSGSGIGLLRPEPTVWKVFAATLSAAYLMGFGCVLSFGLI